MTLSHVSRRALLLSIVVILGVSILAVAVVSLSFSHAAARTSAGVQHQVAAQTIPGGHKVSSRNTSSGHGAARESTNEYAAVPSWDAPTRNQFVFIHEMHQGNWYAVNGIQSC
jgi:hypothetical protein